MNVAITQTNDLSVPRNKVVSASIASVLGWSLDLFDLFVLLYVAPVVGALFFPSSNPTLSLASVYASFAVTLLMRPVGSGIFGSYADRNGRKKAMTVAVTGVGFSTAILGVLPTVHQVGALAPILFLMFRLVQGVFVGGVVASTHTIGTETVAPKWRGFMSGLVGGGGAGIGSLFASIVYLIVSNIFTGDQFNVWGWRFMFFAGILCSILGLFVFKSLEESPLWAQQRAHEQQQTAPKAPVRTVFSGQYLPIVLVNLLIVLGGGAAYYLTSGFLPTFLKVVNKISHNASSGILIEASFVAIFSAMLFGYLSDFTGRKKMFIILGILCLIGLPLSYIGLAHATSLGMISLYALILAFLGNAAYAPILIYLNERFPTAIRSSGTGLSWNMGFAIGGMMPTFVSLASGSTGNIPHTLVYFSIGIFILYLIGSFVTPETKGNLH
ncbi:MFS transporter [Alicyclobacillus dauci]|uniref:MFS transporter n=1 Tax=Alicyclobacillus dauci TaxID=1475485 RepID=A0ABY6Z8U4_9BACL|nr:MFS transporter [Alicyclobacillus dauci]WAH39145.1 MFS transporter [Alicyclobacillus dauci]